MNNIFYTNVSPHLSKFTIVKIYNYELAKIDLEIAQSFNKKNIHSALDGVDFKILRRTRLMNEVLKLTCEKLKLGDEILIKKEGLEKYLIIDGVKYNLVFIMVGHLPFVNLNDEKTIVFIHLNDFTKVYYCGVKETLLPTDITLINEKTVLKNFENFIDIKSY
jgi:hypothetical protein